MLNRAIDWALEGCGVIAMAAVIGMGGLITADVIMRSTGFGVVRGGVEAVEYLMFLTALFAAPWVLRHNAHIRIDFILEKAGRRAALFLEVSSNAIGLVVIAIFMFYTARIGLQSAAEGRNIYKNFIFPEWWIYAAAELALAMLWIEFLRRTLRPFAAAASTAKVP